MTEKLNPRKIARLITKGKIQQQFIGLKSFEVLEQEIFSLLNRHNPQTMTEFEKTVFAKDVAATVEGILKLKPRDQDNLFAEFNKNLNDFHGTSSKVPELESSNIVKIAEKIKNSIINPKSK